VWTWTAIDADTKLVPCFMVGNRDAVSAKMFIDDLASRLASRVQLTTDGHKVYLTAVEGAFGCDVDYAMLVKTYESSPDARSGSQEARSLQEAISPVTCIPMRSLGRVAP
jgi:GTPase